MLNDSAKLNPRIFSKHVDSVPVRDGYGRGLLEAGARHQNVVVLSADLEESTRCHWFSKLYPDRFIEMGIAEQNMAGVAAGLGVSGKTPFINSYATFSPGRNWEHIRTLCAYNDSNVKIVGHHAGVSTGPDGATHQAIEDIALMRAIPNMSVVVPCDALEAHKATVTAATLWGPTYLRLQREQTPVITTADTPFVFGKAQEFWISKKIKPSVLLVAAGPLLYHALLAAKDLEAEKIGSVVLNMATIKPLDEKTLITWVKKIGTVVTCEEHSVIGGLGGAVAEVLAKTYPVPMESVGIQDVFGQSGSVRDLLEHYHLMPKDIVRAAKKVIARL